MATLANRNIWDQTQNNQVSSLTVSQLEKWDTICTFSLKNLCLRTCFYGSQYVSLSYGVCPLFIMSGFLSNILGRKHVQSKSLFVCKTFQNMKISFLLHPSRFFYVGYVILGFKIIQNKSPHALYIYLIFI